MASTDEFRSLTKIHPVADGSIYSLVKDLRSVFYNLCPIRDKSQISSTLFEKLMLKDVINEYGLMKVDLTLAYQQCAAGARYMNFLDFCHLMQHFYEVKMVNEYSYPDSFAQFVQACLL